VVGWEEAAREERLKLVLDKARHALAVAPVRRLGEERLQVLPYHPMQHVPQRGYEGRGRPTAGPPRGLEQIVC